MADPKAVTDDPLPDDWRAFLSRRVPGVLALDIDDGMRAVCQYIHAVEANHPVTMTAALLRNVGGEMATTLKMLRQRLRADADFSERWETRLAEQLAKLQEADLG